MPLTETFRGDIKFLFEKLKKREPFAFSKYADGEYKILRNEKITNCDKWTFRPEFDTHEHELLLESFTYKHPDYYVGISCPCCQPKEHVQWMRDNVDTGNVTWANLFVNSNYEFFKENFFDVFDRWNEEVVFVGNIRGIYNPFPFKVDRYIPVDIGSWKLPELSFLLHYTKIMAKKKNGQLFLFSAGPLGNILAYVLHSMNPNNTYIDIGSTINPWVVGKNRRYLKGNNNKTCVW